MKGLLCEWDLLAQTKEEREIPNNNPQISNKFQTAMTKPQTPLDALSMLGV